ncbi:MAG TPA: hypothetical protein VI932_00630 [Bacteroidota bacterium]|nr:hypothetical protein [Bacteroidota bacterium]
MSFPKQVFLTMSAICVAGYYPLEAWGPPGALSAAVAAGIMATVNVLAGYAAIEYSVSGSMNTFMKFVLGGMGVRLVVMTGALLLLIRVFGFHATALVASLGVFYVAYLALEVIFIQKKLNRRQSS